MKVWMIHDKENGLWAKLGPPPQYVTKDPRDHLEWVGREDAHVFRLDPTAIVADSRLRYHCEVLPYQLVPHDLVVVTGECETGVYVNGKLVEPLNGHDDEADLMHALGVSVEFHEVSHDDLPENLCDLEL